MDLMPASRSEVNIKGGIDGHAALGVAIDLQHPGLEIGVELVVPGAVERVGHVETAAVHAELQHLRPAIQLARVPVRSVGDGAEEAAALYLAGELGVGG